MLRAGRGDLADGFCSGLPVAEEDPIEAFDLRQGMHAQRGAGENAEAAFRPEDEVADVGAGGAGREGWEIERAEEALQVAAEEVILDPAVVIGLLAGGSGGDPTSERGELEGLWEVTEGEAVRGQLGLEMRAADASFESRQVRRGIDVQEPAHVGEVEGDDGRAGLPRVDVYHNARTAPVGNQAGAELAGQAKQEPHLVVGSGVSNPVGNGAD